MFKKVFAMILCASTVAFAQGNSFNKVRYLGGTVATKVSPKDWHNRLTVTSEMITLALKDGQTIKVAPKSVTSLSYGQEAHRRVGTMVALGILVAPVALFGLFHKTRLHYIGIEYTNNGKKAGVLLQGDKSNYRTILVALQGATGVPVSVSPKDRKFIPVGVTTAVAQQSQTAKAVQQNPQTSSQANATGTVTVISNPNAADVYVDGKFVGNTVAVLKLSPGQHEIKVSDAGYKDWSRDLSVTAGSALKLDATLVKK